MTCDCADWKENIEKVNAPLMLAAARSGFRVQYSGKNFIYCPWCGQILTESTELVFDPQTGLTEYGDDGSGHGS